MDLMIAEKQLMGLCDEQLENKGEKERKVTLKDLRSWGAWVAQLVKHPTLDFSSVHDLRVVRSSPVSSSMRHMESAWDSLSPSPLCLPPPTPSFMPRVLCLSKKSEIKKERKLLLGPNLSKDVS